METNAIPHLLIDVRRAEEVREAPLPPELAAAVHIPEEEVRPGTRVALNFSGTPLRVGAV